MKQLLYIGNNLQQHTSNISYIGVLGPLLSKDGYKVSYASSYKNKFLRLMDMLWSIVYHYKKLDYVLIDTYSTQNFYYALLVSQLCRLLRLPYIPILHGGNLSQRLSSSPQMSNLIFKNSHLNVAPSTYLKDVFEDFGYHNLRYIPNVIELSNYTFRNRDFDTPRILWVRSFASLYNPFLAVNVLKSLRDLGYEASLCMVGPDSDGSLQAVKDLANTLAVDVQFTGKLSKEAWIQLSNDSNVFINTSTIDNTPLSVIEAMALGLPIVSTDVGGMPYLIKNGIHGLLVASDHVDAMVEGIRLLIEQREQRNLMILNARELAQSFDWGVVKLAWREVLK